MVICLPIGRELGIFDESVIYNLRQQRSKTTCVHEHLLFAEQLEATKNTFHIPHWVYRKTVVGQVSK